MPKSENNEQSGVHERFVDLLKALSPGQPAPPHPAKPRAPRPPPPFDPVEGVKHSSAAYQFRPIRLKDLWKLHQLDKYDPQKIKKPSFPSYVAAGVKAIPTPGFNRLKTMVKSL